MNPRPAPTPARRLQLLAPLCALLCTAVTAQTTTPPAAAAEASPAKVPVEKKKDAGEETLELTPFQVVADNNGYYSSNSMSGTRFNTKLEDLGAAISIMTKEQMTDFGMLDINDIFLYSVGTEGTGTYSDFVINRNGELTDNVSLSPTTANRVRGIAAANVSYGNFETMARMPLDPLILESVEISRGPNANVFGLGNPSGTVNQVPVAANPSRNFAKAEARVDNWDGYRGTLDVNRFLIKDKLAVRFSAMKAEEGFVRKPSGMDTTRYNGMVQYRPFRNTTINASYLYYKSAGNRPNYTPPRDFASYWVAAGKPGWDPITQMVVMPNGTTLGPFINDNFLTSGIGTVFNRSGAQFQRSDVFVNPEGIFYWTAPTNNTANTPASNTGSGATAGAGGTLNPAGFIRLFSTSPGPNGATGKFTDQPLFNTVPSVKGDVYDFNSINLAAPNFVSDKNDTYYATLDQVILNTPTQLLAAQAGFFRETSSRYRKVPIGDNGSGGQNGQLWVDVNLKNLDGTPNVNYGRPFLGVSEPVYTDQPAQWDTYRAQLAYRYDFTQSNTWTKWLGTHNLSPYYEYKYRVQRQYGYREAIGSSLPWLAVGQPGVVSNFAVANQANVTGGPQAGPNIARPFYRLYVGDANGTNVDYAPGPINPGTYNFLWGTIGNWRNDPTELKLLATTNNTGGPLNLKTIIKTRGFVLHDNFLGGKLVTTFGLREDKVYALQGASPQQLINNNTEHDFANDDHWENREWRFSSGKTKTSQFVVRPFRDLKSMQRWADAGGVQGFLGDLLQDVSFTYNHSDNFIPSPPAIDLFLNPLPNQTGSGKDLGVWFNLFDGKLVVRYTHYKNVQYAARNGDANTIAQRVLRLELFAADRYNLFNRARDWYTLQNPSGTLAQAEASALTVMQMTRPQYDTLLANANAGTLAATNDITAKGNEVEVNYNPTRNWTISANFSEQKSINSNVSETIQQWIDARMPVWTSVVDPITNPALILSGDINTQGWAADATNPSHLWWLHRYGGGSQSPAENFAVNVNSPWSVIRETQGKSRPQIRQYAARFSTNYKLRDFTENRYLKNLSIGGAVRWESQASIGYYGVETYPAIITRLDGNRPIYDRPRAYVDLNAAYTTRLFSDRVNTTFRLNVRNVQESGRLQAIGAFPNGEINSYRIVDPRQFILSASFDL